MNKAYLSAVCRTLVSVCICLAFAGSVQAKPMETVLVKDGKGCSTIVLPAKEDAVIRQAAEDLVYHFKKMSGATIPIVNYPALASGVPIYIGVTPDGAKLPVDLTDEAKFRPDGYLIFADGSKVILTAPRVEGVRNAVYGLLEDYLGCHWFAMGEIGEHIPGRSTVKLSIDGGYQVAKPFYEIRTPWYSCVGATMGSALNDPSVPEDYDRKKFQVRNRMGLRGYYGHYWAYIYTKAVFEKYPDLMPFYGGKRQPRGQVCMSNPKAVDVAAEFFIKYFKDNPHQDFYSFVTNDGGGFCECADCKAMASNDAGRMLILANKVLDKVNAIYPGKRLAVNVYDKTFEPPTGDIKAHKNLIGITCKAYVNLPWWMEQIKPITSDHPDIIKYRRGLERWVNEIGLQTVWHHNYYGWFPGPYTMYHTLQEDVDYQTKLGFNGECSQYVGRYMGTDTHMWLNLRLSWDKNLTVDKLLTQFYPLYFGAAAEDMRYVYERLENHMRIADPAVSVPFHAIDMSYTPGLYPVSLLNECLTRVAAARVKVKNDKLSLARVTRDEDSLKLTRLFVESYVASREYYRKGDVRESNKAVTCADEYVRLAGELHFALPYGTPDLMTPFTFEKAGPFAKRDKLSASYGSAWRSRSLSGFKPDRWGLNLPPMTTGEIVYEVKAGNGLMFQEVKCYAKFRPDTKQPVLEVSADDGVTWITLPNPGGWPDATGYTSGKNKFLVRLRVENTSDKEILAVEEWQIKGSVESSDTAGKG